MDLDGCSWDGAPNEAGNPPKLLTKNDNWPSNLLPESLFGQIAALSTGNNNSQTNPYNAIQQRTAILQVNFEHIFGEVWF